MKVLFCIPKIMAVEPAVAWTDYYIYPFEENWELWCAEAAAKQGVDAIFLFAFLEGPYKPKLELIHRIKKSIPIIYMSTDGGCSGAWPALEEFRNAGCFTKIINIDGMGCPGADLVTLTPLEQTRYSYRPSLRDRDIRLGFMGGSGAKGDVRRDTNDALAAKGVLTLGMRDESWGSNAKYTNFMLSSRAIINYPYTGRGQKHVKARAMEAGLAGAVLLEHKGSPLKNYCTPGEDYFEFETMEDVMGILDIDLTTRQRMANSFHQKCRELTDPEQWLKKVQAVL